MNAELTNTRKRTRLDRKFDRPRDAEEAGKLGKSKTSRAAVSYTHLTLPTIA